MLKRMINVNNTNNIHTYPLPHIPTPGNYTLFLPVTNNKFAYNLKTNTESATGLTLSMIHAKAGKCTYNFLEQSI